MHTDTANHAIVRAVRSGRHGSSGGAVDTPVRLEEFPVYRAAESRAAGLPMIAASMAPPVQAALGDVLGYAVPARGARLTRLLRLAPLRVPLLRLAADGARCGVVFRLRVGGVLAPEEREAPLVLERDAGGRRSGVAVDDRVEGLVLGARRALELEDDRWRAAELELRVDDELRVDGLVEGRERLALDGERERLALDERERLALDGERLALDGEGERLALDERERLALDDERERLAPDERERLALDGERLTLDERERLALDDERERLALDDERARLVLDRDGERALDRLGAARRALCELRSGAASAVSTTTPPNNTAKRMVHGMRASRKLGRR